MNKETLIVITKEYTPRQVQLAQSSELKAIKKFILESTKFLDGDHKIAYTIASRVFCVLNDIDSIPLCKCGCILPPDRKSTGWGNGFAKSCSLACSRTLSKMGQFEKNIKSYDWMFEQRITLKKSIDQIALETNTTYATIGKWMKLLKIPQIKLNESDPEIKMLLRDREFLYKKHKVEHLTCQQIAEQIGSSKATVAIALESLGIIANESNSYDRKIVKTSKWQKELSDYIASIYDGEILLNKRGVIGSNELDIYLPEIKLAIECNGVFYHQYQPQQQTESAKKGINYHLNKTKQCESLGITLLHFFDITWDKKSDIIKSMVCSRIKKSEHIIYGRKCDVRVISVYDKNQFLENNHIQGKDKSLLHYGLFFENKLVSAMTIGRSRFNKSYQWELSRYCSLLHHSVVGGFSKLLKHHRSLYKGSIISYADRMYSTGHVYITNGFVLSHTNRPSYYYIDFNKNLLLHRSNFRKSKIGATESTEQDKMIELGYGKIFDCGNYAFVMK